MCWDGTGASYRTRRSEFLLGSPRDRCSDLEKRVLPWLLGLPFCLSVGPPCGFLSFAAAANLQKEVVSKCFLSATRIPLTCFLPDVCLVCLFMLASCHSPTHCPQMVRKVGLLA